MEPDRSEIAAMPDWESEVESCFLTEGRSQDAGKASRLEDKTYTDFRGLARGGEDFDPLDEFAKEEAALGFG